MLNDFQDINIAYHVLAKELLNMNLTVTMVAKNILVLSHN